MNVLILYFSGTGNTYFIADKLYTELTRQSYSVKLMPVEQFQVTAIESADVLIFGFPVYACDMPDFMHSILQQIKKVNKKGLIVYSTLGFYAGNSSRKILNLLSQKGFTPLDYEEIKMPGSDGLVFMKKDSKYVKNVLTTNFSKSLELNKAVRNIVDKINQVNLRGIANVAQKVSGLNWGRSVISGIVQLISGFVETKLKRKFWVDDKCIKCGLCTKICPSGNIILQGDRVEFSDKCYLCMRCINQCPVEAIQIGEKTKGKFRYKGPMGRYNPHNILAKEDDAQLKD